MCHQRMLTQLFTLPDTDTETYKKWVVGLQNCVEVFMLHQNRYLLGYLHMFRCLAAGTHH